MRINTLFNQKYFIGVLTALFMVGCGGSPSAPARNAQNPTPAPSQPQLDYQGLLDDAISAAVPGMVLLVESGTERHWISAGVSDSETLEEMPLDARMPIGSVGKTMIAALVALLVDEGVLDLDRPIGHYLDTQVTKRLSNGDVTTLRQLLNHTAGVRDYLGHPEFLPDFVEDLERIWLDSDLLPYILDRNAISLPGEQFNYSNTGYVLVGLVISSVLEQHSSEALKQRLFAPLGMDSTRYLGLETSATDIISGYRDLMEFNLAEQPTIGNLRPYLYRLGVSDAPVATTVEDLAIWQAALQDSGFLADKSLLTALTASENLIRLNGIGGYLPNSSVSYGLGMFKEVAGDTTLYHHGGDQFGWLTHNLMWPEKGVNVALMVNCGGDICEQAASTVMNEIVAHYLKIQ